MDLAREHVPDMILLDLYLPDMTGNIVLDRLAEDPATADIPVAVIGADAPAQQVRQLLGRGVMGSWPSPSTCAGSCRSSTPCGAGARAPEAPNARIRWPARALPSRDPGACACRACRWGHGACRR